MQIFVGLNGKAKRIKKSTAPENSDINNNDNPTNIISYSLPIGFVIPFASNLKPPSNYLLCNGQELNREKYKKLFNLIGITYGEGDGETTFNLPKINDRFIEGGEIAGELKEAGLPNIVGDNLSQMLSSQTGTKLGTGAFTKTSFTNKENISNQAYYAGRYNVKFDASDSNPIYGASDTVQPPSITMKYYIVATEDNANGNISSTFNFGGVPIGTVLPYMGKDIPEGFKLCNGGLLSKEEYNKLYLTLGEESNSEIEGYFKLPDLTGKFLEGGTEAGNEIEAGLPNITGKIGETSDWGIVTSGLSSKKAYEGAFTAKFKRAATFSAAAGDESVSIEFDASLSNPIYGKSGTVQPPAVTVKYIIKAVETESNSNTPASQVSNDDYLKDSFTIIYPNGGTKETPAEITINSTYTEPNPFDGYYVNCIAEIYLNDKWIPVQHLDFCGSNTIGILAMQISDGSIQIKTGDVYLTQFNHNWQIDTYKNGYTTKNPCRVKVWKIGKIEE